MEQINYRKLKGYKYELATDYSVETNIRIENDIQAPGLNNTQSSFIQLSKTGRLTIAKFYAWDGPSGPTFDTANFMRGSLVHDALYQLMRLNLLHISNRKAADKLLAQICKEDGMSAPRAWWVYQGVHIFGKSSAAPTGEEDNGSIVITAP